MLSKIKDFRSSFYQFPLAEGKTLRKLEQKIPLKQLHCPGQFSKKDAFCLAPSLFTQFLPYSSISRNFFSGLSTYSQMIIDAHISSPNYYSFPALRYSETNSNGRWKGFSKRKPNSLLKRSYCTFPQGKNPVETNRNNKTINDKSYLNLLKNNIQSILDKQIKQINELRSKRVKKDIHSAVPLQKMVVDRIREGNKPEKIMNRRHNKLKSFEEADKADNMDSIRFRSALEGNSHSYMSNNSSLVPISVKKPQEVRYVDNFKDRYLKEKKSFDNHENEDLSMLNRNNFSKSLDSGKRSDKNRHSLNLDKNNSADKDSKPNNCEFNDMRTHEVTAHHKTIMHENMLPFREKMEKLHQYKKGNILLKDSGFLRIPQFTGGMQNKQEFNQGKLNETEVDRICRSSAEKKINNEKFCYSLTPLKTKTDVCPFTTTKGDLTTNLTNSAYNSLKSDFYKREKYIRASPSPNKEDIYKPRERRQRQLPNLVRRNNQVSQSPNVGFSHNAVYLKDSELYRKFKAVERERHLRTIYNTHWDKGKQRGFNVRKASLVNISQTTPSRTRMFNTTKPVVVHKLNASSIAEKIKLKAKALNQNTERDKLLQPQLYCRKSFSYGLAQLPIMPCKNVVTRDLGDNVLKKRRIVFSRKENPKHSTSNKLYTNSLKKSPFWANQKMMSGNVIKTNSPTTSTNPKRRKVDFKGTLKYIMNFKSRLQQQ